MNPLHLIKKYYSQGSKSFHFLVEHSRLVTEESLAIAKRFQKKNPDLKLNLNLKFIKEAAMLHDIGIFKVNDPEICCTGTDPYIMHGVRGREILEKEKLPKHALVCERHLSCGITKEEIINKNLPLPPRDMSPINIEEQIISYADKFFSKFFGKLHEKKSIDEIRTDLKRFAPHHIKQFEKWVDMFGE